MSVNDFNEQVETDKYASDVLRPAGASKADGFCLVMPFGLTDILTHIVPSCSYLIASLRQNN